MGLQEKLFLLLILSLFFAGCAGKAQVDQGSAVTSDRSSESNNIYVLELVSLDGDEIIREINIDANPEFFSLDESELPSLYGYVSDYQSRVSQICQIQSLMDKSISAYYQHFRAVPDSLETLVESDFCWFEPLEQYYSPGLELVERELGPPRVDLNTFHLSFTDTGYSFKVYKPHRDEENPEEFFVLDFSKEDVIGRLESYYSEFDPDSKFIDSDPVNVRICYLNAVCTRLLEDYWVYHLDFPESGEELLDGKWTVRQEIINSLPTIDEGEFGWFYFGVSPEHGIAYTSYILLDRGAVETQKIYIKDDPQKEDYDPGFTIVGRYASFNEMITLDDTIPLIDSSIPGWGF